MPVRFDMNPRMHPNRDRALVLRKSGASYSEIEKETGITRSTLSYMLRGMVLTENQKQRLSEKMREAGRARLGWVPSHIVRKQLSISGKKRWKKDPKIRILLREGRKLGHLTFRKDEIPIKSALERLLGVSVKREVLGKRVIDFVTDNFLIEYTTDHTHGVFDLVRRFEDSIVKGDHRKKIAYLPIDKIGKKTRNRLIQAGVEIRDYRALG